MWRNILQALLVCLVIPVVSGCYNTPVRHLVSDVGLVKAGISTKEEVVMFLGEPDSEFEEDGNLLWVYSEKKKTAAEKLPLIGKKFGEPEETRVVIHFRGEVVSKVDFSVSDPDDLRWQHHFPQEKE